MFIVLKVKPPKTTVELNVAIEFCRTFMVDSIVEGFQRAQAPKMAVVKQILAIVFFLCLGLISSEIELTFSNEKDYQQSFIVKTENHVEDQSSETNEDTISLHNGVIAILKIMKDDLVLLEKSTADIGSEGYDIDIESDFLDAGENQLDLLLLSANGTILQRERITVVSPPVPTNVEDIDTDAQQGVVSGSAVNEEGTVKSSLFLTLREAFHKYSSAFAKVRAVISTSKKRYNQLMKVAGVVTGGAMMFSRMPSRSDQETVKPSGLPVPAAPQLPKQNDKKDPSSKYISKFPLYPMQAALKMDFSSPKTFVTKRLDTTTVATAPSSSSSLSLKSCPRGGRGGEIATNVKDLLLGKPRTPKSLNLLLSGGVALLGAQAARCAVIKYSKQKHDSEAYRGGFFRIGTTKVKKRWKLGQFLRRV